MNVSAVLSSDLDSRRQVGALYSLHHGWLQGWLTSRMGNACEAADLTQDTFLRVLLAVGRSEPALRLDVLQEPRAYLTTVAKRLLFNHYRRQSLERVCEHDHPCRATTTLARSISPYVAECHGRDLWR